MPCKQDEVTERPSHAAIEHGNASASRQFPMLIDANASTSVDASSSAILNPILYRGCRPVLLHCSIVALSHSPYTGTFSCPSPPPSSVNMTSAVSSLRK